MISLLFGGGSNRDSHQAADKLPTFTIDRLRELYAVLSSFRESDLDRHGFCERMVETVRQITEALVWGEQNDEAMFKFFCDKGIFSDFVRVLAIERAPKKLKVQLLQSLSMLLQNIHKQQSLYYILSKGQVNRLITQPLDLNDEEILAYFITLLKSLAMRLDSDTARFFFDLGEQPENRFPLYTQATKLFDHKDQMVRATVRTITLRVYPVQIEAIKAFVQKHAEESYFSRLAMHLRDIWLRLNKAAVIAEDPAAVQHANDLQQDLLIYLCDVFELGHEKLNQVLADRLLNGTLAPLLLASIDEPNTPQAVVSRSIQTCQRLAPKVALFLLRHVVDIIRSPHLVEPLMAAVLHDRGRASPEEDLPPGIGEGDDKEYRRHFLRFLRSLDDTAFMFSTGVVHGCIRHRQTLSPTFFEKAHMIPETGTSEPSRRSVQQPISERNLDVPYFLLQALQRHAAWKPDTFQVLVQVVRELFADRALANNPGCRTFASSAMQRAYMSARGHLIGLVEDRLRPDVLADPDDPLVDVFIEEWEHHRCPLVSVSEACASSWRLLLSAAGSAGVRGRGVAPPAGGSRPSLTLPADDAARRAVRSFLLLRRLLASFSGSMPEDTIPQERSSPMSRWTPTDEPLPLQVATPPADNQEGTSLTLASSEDRIICQIEVKGGPQTRYLLLDPDSLLIVKPDSARPGSVLVTTKWPMQQVHSTIDRGDPRILQIGMQAFPGSVRPGEATEFSPPVSLPETGGQRRPSFFTLALSFEDVRRCYRADAHLQASRQKVRRSLLQGLLEYVQSCEPNATAPASQ